MSLSYKEKDQGVVDAIGLLGKAILALNEASEIKDHVVAAAAMEAAKGRATYLIRAADKKLGLL